MGVAEESPTEAAVQNPESNRNAVALVALLDERGAEKMLPEVGIQAREKGKCDLYFCLYFLPKDELLF